MYCGAICNPKNSGADKGRQGSQEIFVQKLYLRINRHDLKMKDSSKKQDATSEKFPGRQRILKTVVHSLAEASYQKGDGKQAQGRTWYLVDHGII